MSKQSLLFGNETGKKPEPSELMKVIAEKVPSWKKIVVMRRAMQLAEILANISLRINMQSKDVILSMPPAPLEFIEQVAITTTYNYCVDSARPYCYASGSSIGMMTSDTGLNNYEE